MASMPAVSVLPGGPACAAVPRRSGAASPAPHRGHAERQAPGGVCLRYRAARLAAAAACADPRTVASRGGQTLDPGRIGLPILRLVRQFGYLEPRIGRWPWLPFPLIHPLPLPGASRCLSAPLPRRRAPRLPLARRGPRRGHSSPGPFRNCSVDGRMCRRVNWNASGTHFSSACKKGITAGSTTSLNRPVLSWSF